MKVDAPETPSPQETQKKQAKDQNQDDEDEKPKWMGHEKVMMTNQDGKEESEGSAGEDYDSMMTPEEKEEELLRAQVKKHEAQKIKEYQEKLQSTTLADFEDRPDPIEEVRVVKSADNFLVIEWDKPCENNQPILSYNVYLSSNPSFEDAEMIDQVDPDQAPEPGDVNQKIVQQYTVIDLEQNTSYYVKIRAENQLGEGYEAKFSQIISTIDASMHKPSSLYVWGNNSSSEIGLTDDIVEENKENYNQVKCSMMVPVKHKMFNGLLYNVIPGNVNSMFHCVNANEHTCFLVTCGMTNMVSEGCEEIERNEITKKDLMNFEDVASIPYSVDFDIPVVKVICGDLFSGILTAEGSVFTWGYNTYGQLGVKNKDAMFVQRPQLLKFEDKDTYNQGAPIFIKDLACGFNHCLALTDKNKIFVWGRRMGIYSNIELNYHWLRNNKHHLEVELNQSTPRMLKDSLIFYNIDSLRAGLYNSALITKEKQVLLHGMNDYGQMGLGQEIGNMTPFFPNFLKHDFFTENKLDVLDCTFTAASTHFLCRDRATCKNRLFSVGNNQFGQLGNNSILASHTPVEITDRFDAEVKQISSGGYHTLVLTASNQVYGFGKLSHGQLGKKWVKDQPKFASVPIPIAMPTQGKINKVACGSLFSMIMVTDE